MDNNRENLLDEEDEEFESENSGFEKSHNKHLDKEDEYHENAFDYVTAKEDENNKKFNLENDNEENYNYENNKKNIDLDDNIKESDDSVIKISKAELWKFIKIVILAAIIIGILKYFGGNLFG